MQVAHGSAAAATPLLANAVRQTMSKGDFARYIKVSAGRVSQLISANKIYGEALEGEGRSARIVPDIACRQLGVTLDVVQMSAQMRPIPTFDAGGVQADPPVLNESQQRHQQIKIEQAEIALRKAQREEEATNGTYILAEAARREWGRMLAEVLTGLDELMPQMGEALARECGGDPQAVTLVLKRMLREWRARQAAGARVVADQEPALVADEREVTDG